MGTSTLRVEPHAGTYAFFTGSTLTVEPESSDLILKIVSVSVRVANLTIPSLVCKKATYQLCTRLIKNQ